MKQVVSLLKNLLKLKPKMYLFLLDDSSSDKKEKDVNKNVVALINHNLLIKECLTDSTNRIQSKGCKIGTCKINKI